MRKKLLFILLFSILQAGYGQYGFLELPQIWLRADTLSEQSHVWSNITGTGNDARFSGETPVFSSRKLNYHKALSFSGAQPIIVPSYHFTSKDLTVIIVYSVPDSLDECGLWQVQRDSTSRLGLTTQHILSESSEIRYIDSNKTGVIINTLSQHWRNLSLVGFVKDIQIGFGDDFAGTVAEFLLFDKKLSKEQVTGWASYLAVKYGVTLYDMPYFSSDSIMVWNNFEEFSFAIIGLGRDMKTDLHQRQTEGLEGKIVFGINTPVSCNETHPDAIAEGDYLLWGFDAQGVTNPQDLILFDDVTFTAYGNGLLQRTGTTASSYSTFIQVDASQWQSPKMDYKLLIDREGTGEFEHIEIYAPDSITSDSILCFSNVYWDTDNNGFDRFCFAALPNIQPRSLTSDENDTEEESNPNKSANQQINNSIITPLGNKYELYPNPNRGSYIVSAELKKPASVEVTVYTSDGKLLKREVKANGLSYRFSGFISTPGNYLVEIRSSGESKIFKMIVQ